MLSEESRKYTTINARKGLFRYTRIPFSVSTALVVFQRTVDTLLKGIPNVTVYLDGILVLGQSDKDHLDNLSTLLSRLETAGMRLKKSKCSFFLSEVEYLGHCITPDGLKPSPSKVEAIVAAPPPTDVSQLKAFLGLVNYYGRFLTNLASTLVPLYKLLRKHARWCGRLKMSQHSKRSKTS